MDKVQTSTLIMVIISKVLFYQLLNDNVIDFRINVIDSNGLVTSNEQGEISPIKSISCLNCK